MGAKKSDAERRLTREGSRKMGKAAGGLKRLVGSIDLIAASPLLRAQQTAQIVAKAFDGAKTVQVGALSPRKPLGELLDWLKAQPSNSTVALVGHEPHLSTFLCWILTGLQESFVELKKGGMAMVESTGPVAAGRGKLLWMLKPGQLRRISRR